VHFRCLRPGRRLLYFSSLVGANVSRFTK